jgi:hypothetical protein
MYTLLKSNLNQSIYGAVTQNGSETISFHFDPLNYAYRNFKKDLANGVELKDAEGNQMTPEQITTFLETLP